MIAARALVPAVLLLLAGCATLERAPAPGAAGREAALLALDHWDARGRIAIRSAVPVGPDGTRGGSGNLAWSQAPGESHIVVSGPFGAGAIDIRWTGERLTIVTRDGEVAADLTGPGAAEAFLESRLGWSFPVGSTRYWLLGIPDPAAPSAVDADDVGRPVRISQHGWDVTYEDFAAEGGLWLPRKFAMDSEHGRLKFVVDRWQLPNGP